ncbi:cytochrome b [Falsiroseomonas ponticola]|uniref:cytochrome b n=1 Tax=Falsiroseomonas ponticola TaxID=2786951 RepID=UPI001934465C|nr:cytochrome b [Roseomonas ponticola]
MRTRYSIPTIALHWTMAAAIGAAWLLGQVMEDFARGPDRVAATGAHALVGLAVLALVLPRLLARWLGGAPMAEAGWQGRLASAGHLLLYALMAAVPLAGLAILLSGRAPFPVLGLFEVPPLLAPLGLRKALEGVHEVLANLMVGAIALHVAATLWHALVRRDQVAARMLPFLSRRPPPAAPPATSG